MLLSMKPLVRIGLCMVGLAGGRSQTEVRTAPELGAGSTLSAHAARCRSALQGVAPGLWTVCQERTCEGVTIASEQRLQSE